MNILFVDDEPDLEALITQKFRRHIRDGSGQFLFARDGIEALETLKANSDIDLVVSDINMPRMDGLTLLQKLQDSDTGMSTIIVSAYGDMANIRTAMNRGAFDFVTNPIDFTDLETTIAKTLRHIESLRAGAPPPGRSARACVAVVLLLADLGAPPRWRGGAGELEGRRREIATLFTDITTSPRWSKRWSRACSGRCSTTI